MDGFGFRPVKTDRIDSLFDLFERKRQHRDGLVRQGKQPLAGFGGRFIFGAEAEKTGDQDPEWIAVRFTRHDSHDRFLPLTDLSPDDPDGGMDLVLTHLVRLAWSGEC